MKLFINAGGKGTRLYPITKDVPKPMLPIFGKPILERLVEWGKENKITEIIIMSGYKAEAIGEYFKDGKDFGIPIKHSIEPYPLGSGGPIKFAKQHIDGPFFYISGDQICTVNLTNMLEFHKQNNADMTIYVNETEHPEDSDTLRVNTEGKVTQFLTKFEPKDPKDNLSNRGLCIIEPKVLNLMDKEIFNFENEIYPKMLQHGMRLYAYQTNEFMEDMGTPERLKKCEEFLQSKMERVLVTGACGMMGQHLLPLLLKKGNYNILGTYFRPTTNIKELPKEVKLKELDVRDYRAVLKVMEEFKPDKILHLAAQSYPTVSLDEPQYTVDTNIKGTINIFEAVRYLKLNPTVLVACSSAEYGFVDEKDVPIKETQPLLPLHPYGVSKVGQDLLSYQYYKNYGIRTLRARIFNTTGPKKVNDVCADFTKQAVLIEKGLQENKLYIGNIDTRRAITDVRDMIEAFLLLMEKGEAGEVYNISGEKAYLIKDILEMILKETNINPEIIVDPK
ncbi:NAD-dependent epimerase/dehydratase family protein, partial [Candidatus Woesearchaeota archaeon]|nr:NAD-dependent epimerase/dehydratase family protein [Candidatus Woesearchaeota archaeon]